MSEGRKTSRAPERGAAEAERIAAEPERVAAEPARVPRTLVAGVGYRELADFSVGPLAVDQLAAEALPDHVEVDDFSYNPVAAVHTLQERQHRYGRIVLIGATRRGRAPGSVVTYRWDRVLPAGEQIQARVAEAVTGVIDLDNLLVILGQFDVLPDEVVVVEVEPAREAFGEAMSRRGEAGLRRALVAVRELVAAAGLDHVQRSSLGGSSSDA